MCKVFGIILIVVGLATLPKALSTSSGAEAFGAFIGVSIVTFLPACFLLMKGKRKEGKKEEGDK